MRGGTQLQEEGRKGGREGGRKGGEEGLTQTPHRLFVSFPFLASPVSVRRRERHKYCHRGPSYHHHCSLSPSLEKTNKGINGAGQRGKEQKEEKKATAKAEDYQGPGTKGRRERGRQGKAEGGLGAGTSTTLIWPRGPLMPMPFPPSLPPSLSFLSQREDTPRVAHAWAWVKELDELQCEMKVRRGREGGREGGREDVLPPYLVTIQTFTYIPPLRLLSLPPLLLQAGRVFSGFSEGEIAFPPSFRWRRGAVAGDFTDTERLAASYVLQKKGDGQVRREGGREGGREEDGWVRKATDGSCNVIPPSLPPSLPPSPSAFHPTRIGSSSTPWRTCAPPSLSWPTRCAMP